MTGKRRGQMKISFGMIFSIILIIVFLVFGFYAIKTFINFQNSATMGKFFSDFQSEVDRVWRSAESSQEREYFLPSKIIYFCVADLDSSSRGEHSNLLNEFKESSQEDGNSFVYPVGIFEIDSKKSENLDLWKITEEENPFCIEVLKGKLKLTLVKNFGENLVNVRE